VAKKKKSPKKTTAKSAPPSRLQGGLLPGLGGVPWAPEPKPMSRMDMERFNRALSKLMGEKEFESEEELNAFMASLTGPGKLDEILDAAELDPEDEAQDLAYEAMEAESDTEAKMLCRRALKLDPHCLDALILLADIETTSTQDYAERLRAVVRGAEEHFGEAFMEENRGHFWGLVETRPYMRARQSLAESLLALDEMDAAIAEYEGMLALNPGDNQGHRDVLRGLYLEAGNLEGVRRLNKEYDDGMFAIPAWSAVLERFLSDDLKQAEKLLRAAHKYNRHVAGYLTGTKPLPKEGPGRYSPGDPNEAALCVILLGKAWFSHPEAIVWLRGLTLK